MEVVRGGLCDGEDRGQPALRAELGNLLDRHELFGRRTKGGEDVVTLFGLRCRGGSLEDPVGQALGWCLLGSSEELALNLLAFCCDDGNHGRLSFLAYGRVRVVV